MVHIKHYLSFVINEIRQNETIVEELTERNIENEIANGNFTFDTDKIVNQILDKINNEQVNLKNISNSN